MALVEFGKSLHRRATDLFSGQPIVFHHVPKCGGTSVGRSLRRAYLLSQGTVTPKESEDAFDAAQKDGHPAKGHVAEFREMMLLYLLFSGTRCVSAHIPFSNAAFEKFSGRYAFVTLLRDPVERFISNYFWSHKHPGGVAHIPQSLEEFVQTDRARLLGSTYVRYFCGEPRQDFAAAQAEDAIRNLRRMDSVGFLDRVADFEADLHRLTGRRIKIGKENVANSASNREAIMSGPLGEKIKEACRLDIQVWNGVQDLRGPASEVSVPRRDNRAQQASSRG